mmetsp:Transcript_8916/g.14464  ORF Transcript_8916/g.14464 Transcript_8916/m.14464 type:complete len:201 (-) Transcript_8916:5828-6430(-)
MPRRALEALCFSFELCAIVVRPYGTAGNTSVCSLWAISSCWAIYRKRRIPRTIVLGRTNSTVCMTWDSSVCTFRAAKRLIRATWTIVAGGAYAPRRWIGGSVSSGSFDTIISRSAVSRPCREPSSIAKLPRGAGQTPSLIRSSQIRLIRSSWAFSRRVRSVHAKMTRRTKSSSLSRQINRIWDSGSCFTVVSCVAKACRF